ncbi:MAG: hypothetical protein WCG04_07245, partial [Alphaproteobacteria bacterium]
QIETDINSKKLWPKDKKGRLINPRKNPGDYGLEIHQRAAANLKGKPGWIAEDIYIEKRTNKILSFNQPPPGVPNKNWVQIDIMKTKDGYIPQRNSILDISKVSHIGDIKGSYRGTMGPKQKAALLNVLNGWPKDQKFAKHPYIHPVSRVYHKDKGWIETPSKGVSKKIELLPPGAKKFVTRVIAIFGVAAFAERANALGNIDQYDDELHAIINAAQQAGMQTGNIKTADQVLLLMGPVKTYLAHFVGEDNTVLDVAIRKAVIDVLNDK